MNTFLLQPGENQSVYFASDFHLGVPDHAQSLDREKRIVEWLDQIAENAHALILLGDVFDFWFEYKHVVPKGYIRLLGKLAELSDRGLKIILFTGNHDLWLKDYLVKEIGLTLSNGPMSMEIGDKKFYLAHGDGLGPGDKKFKFYKKIFTNPLCQWLFRWLHPDLGIALAKWWSNGSRESQLGDVLSFQGDNEWLIVHSRQVHLADPHDYYIYGHRHLAGVHQLDSGSIYVNLGEWMNGNSFAEYNGSELKLRQFQYED